jgi:hypothetical protein
MKHVVTMHSERRIAERQDTALETMIEDGGVPSIVVLLEDISEAGFGMVAVVRLTPGDLITVELPRISSKAASVVWQSGVRFGCAFKTPITADELQRVAEAGAERQELAQQRAASGWRPGVAALAA